MAVTTSGMDEYICAFADRLVQQEEIARAKTQVSTAFVSSKKLDKWESIQILSADTDQEWGAVGNRRREEEFDVEGSVFVRFPGNTEQDIRDCRRRAMRLLREIELVLREWPQMHRIDENGVSVPTCKTSGLAHARMEIGPHNTGQALLCVIDFTITVERTLPR